jgi:3-dehydroquinate synthase
VLFYQPLPLALERRIHVSTIDILVATPPSPYAIRIGAGLLATLGAELDAARFPRRRLLVSSPVVWRLIGERVQASMPGVPVVLAPDGERHKHLRTVSKIYDAFLAHGADRGTGIVAVGGGVLGDTAGFAAASFLRGLALAQVPTTLLAQVDSSVGGKVGVNHPLGKNLIGAFHQPRLVAIDPLVLETLPRREFRAGLYEVVKYGMTSSRDLFDRVNGQASKIFRRSPEVMTPIIAESCRIKADVVAADEREGGVRRVLNFGHTAGHALEAVTGYKRLRHGEAVAYGMLVASELSVARGRMPAEDLARLRALIAKLGKLPPISDISAAAIVEASRRDKKVVDGTLHFVLCTGIGSWAIAEDVREEELREAAGRVGFAP